MTCEKLNFNDEKSWVLTMLYFGILGTSTEGYQRKRGNGQGRTREQDPLVTILVNN